MYRTDYCSTCTILVVPTVLNVLVVHDMRRGGTGCLDIWALYVVRRKRKDENCASAMGMSFRRNPSICTIVRNLRRRLATVRKMTKIRFSLLFAVFCTLADG